MREISGIRPLAAWFWDGIAVAYLMSGGLAFDPRIAVTAWLSLNQIFAVVLVGRLIVLAISRHDVSLRAPATLGAVTLLTLLLLVRAVGATNAEYARFKVVSYSLFVVPVLLYFDLSIRNGRDIWRFLGTLALAGCLMVVMSIPHMRTIHDGQRLAVLAGGPNVYARIVGTGVLSTILLYARRRNRSTVLRGTWLLAWLPLAVLGLLLAGTKTVLAALVIAGCVVLIQNMRRRASAALALCLVLGAAVPIVTHDLVSQRNKDGGLVRLLRKPDMNDPTGSFGARIRYLRSSWVTLRDSPWLGTGTGDWGAQEGLGPHERYPHNILLEILSELGALGLLLVAVPWLFFPRTRRVVSEDERLLFTGLTGLAVFWGLNVSLSGDLVDSRYVWLFLLVLETHMRHYAVRVFALGRFAPLQFLNGTGGRTK